MTGSPSAALLWEVQQVEALPDYPSLVNSGINGDQSHFGANTYHIGILELPTPGGYTNRTWEDKMPAAGSGWHSSATDESMSTADMVKNWNRHLAVFNDYSDPRRQYLAEYIGWNGVGSAERLDFQANTRTASSPDHKWHRHRAKRRRWYSSMVAAHACVSIDKGETKQQYLVSIGQGPPVPLPSGEESMEMFHAVDDQGTAVATDDVVYFALVGSDLSVKVHPARQDTANILAGTATGNSNTCTKAVWNDLMDWLGHTGHRFAVNADGTLGDMTETQA